MTIAINRTRIRQIISRQIVSVTPETPLAESIAIMADARISCIVVVEKKRPVGIFTERDLVKLADRQMTFGDQPIRDIMTTPVVTIPGSLSIYEAYSIMLTNRIRHHIVVDHSGRLLGLMTQSDLINHLGHEYFLEMRKIEQVMTADVTTVPRYLTISQALSTMADRGISCVVVVDEGERRPLGILSERDAVRLIADRIDLGSVLVGSVMSSPVLTVEIGATVHKATMLMKTEHIRRMVVVDEHGGIAGIITQTDIVKGLEGKYIELLKEIIRDKEDVFQQTARELLDKTLYLDNILNSTVNMAIIATDSAFRIKYFNPAAEKVFDCRSAAAIGRSALKLLSLEYISPLSLQQARDVVKKEGRCLFPVEITRDGVFSCFDGSLSGILDKQGKLAGFVMVLNDVTERRRYEDTIHHLAYHDALTGLPNRALLNDRLGLALASAKRTRIKGVLMILDLDRFKDVNDTLGHSMGDQLLTAVSERLKELLRKTDTVARMGGDEFVLLLPTIDSSERGGLIAAKIVAAFREPFACSGLTLNVTASIGFAGFPDDAEDEETLLKKADIALYRVKGEGRDNFQRYT